MPPSRSKWKDFLCSTSYWEETWMSQFTLPIAPQVPFPKYLMLFAQWKGDGDSTDTTAAYLGEKGAGRKPGPGCLGREDTTQSLN